MKQFVLLPTDIKKLWKSTRVKEELVAFLQNLYKPKSQYDTEKVEYNQINILAEFIYYNLIFAKNEMMLDEFKVAVVLDLFWRLLEFDPEDAPDSDTASEMSEKVVEKRASIGNSNSVP